MLDQEGTWEGETVRHETLQLRFRRVIWLPVAAGALLIIPWRHQGSTPVADRAHLPMSFEINEGQMDPRVKFLSRGAGYALYLTQTEAVLALQGKNSGVDRHSRRLASVHMRMLGANTAPMILGVDELPGKVNYFSGNDSDKWHTNVRTFQRVRYENVYRGIDLIYYGDSRQLEYDLVIAPGADPTSVKISLEGADSIDLDKEGNLLLHVGRDQIVKRRPVAYQEIGGTKLAVDASYVVDADAHIVRVNIGEYDGTRPLVIDPVLAYSTYLGGDNYERSTAVAVDAADSVYVVGTTLSCNFPTTATAFRPVCDPTPGDNADVFVTKLNAAGSGLIYSTYLAGSATDDARGIAVDTAGNAYITGFTFSDNFPITAAAFQKTRKGGASFLEDVFVTKLNATGSALVYSTYLGGFGYNIGGGIAVDTAGNAYVVGSTTSESFPTTPGALRGSGGHYGSDYFVTKLNSAGSALVYSTYLGGTAGEGIPAGGIAVDGGGNAYVTGSTYSSDFPTTASSPRCVATLGDAFIAKLNAAGSALVYSACLGGNSVDQGYGVAVDRTGNAYVTGATASSDFPTTPGAVQTTAAPGIRNAFITKVNAAGTSLVYSTYLRGAQARAIAVDVTGSAVVTGLGYFLLGGAQYDLPLVNAIQAKFGGGVSDAFVAKLNSGGSALVYSTYLGGLYDDRSFGLAINSSGDAYVTGDVDLGGSTSDPKFPLANPLQRSYGGFGDAFAARIASDDSPALRAPSGLAVSLSGPTATFTWQAPTSGDPPSSNVLEAGSAPGLADLAKLSLGGAATSFSTTGLGAGVYYVRVRAVTAAGVSGPSNEVRFDGPCTAPPVAPSGLTVVSNSGGKVVLLWNASPGSVGSYVVEAGSTFGATNLANSDLGSAATTLTATGVGRGTYYVRVKAKNACGVSAASNEIVVVVQ